MAEQNKILTVSYGTFSCTLEGFEDSFGTMKAIAEYFRDLASDDRYFGAEPPTPDPEMLSRIAEREIERRVEARTSDGGIVLRAAEALAAPVAPAEAAPDAPAEQPAAEQEAAAAKAAAEAEAKAAEEAAAAKEAAAAEEAARAAAEAEAAEAAAKAEAEAAEQAAKAAAEAEAKAAEEAAAKAEAEAEAQALAEAEAAAQAEAEDVDDAPENAPENAPEDTPDEIAVAEAETPVAEATPSGSEDHPAAEAANEAADLLASSDPVHPSEDTSAKTIGEADDAGDPAPDSVAAKLQRIRAVVGRGAALTEDGETSDEAATDEAAAMDDSTESEAEMPLAAADLAGILGRDTAAPEAEEADKADEVSSETAEAEDDTAAEETPEDSTEDSPVRARVIRMAATPTEDEAETASDDDAAQSPAVDEPGDGGFGGLAALDGADELEGQFDGQMDDLDADLDADLLEELALVEEENAPAPAAEADAEPDAGEDASAEAVADADVNVDAEDPAEDDAEIEAWKAMTQSGNAGQDELVYDAGSASENAFADLDDEAETDDPRAEDTAGADESDAGPQRRDRLAHVPDAGDAVARLMSEADAKMNEPEGRGRREAIAHLKAAVAAKEAARQLGEADDEDGTENAFRDDLREVVRPAADLANDGAEDDDMQEAAAAAGDASAEEAPSEVTAEPETADTARRATRPARPSRPVARAHRKERPRPAPLKLVASQRIDAPSAEGTGEDRHDGPVRPRRIAREDLAPQSSDDGFAAWAEQRGAHALTDLVEAAAAHTIEVDGVEEFSRPQIMRKVRAARAEDSHREDELRAFGTLLRQGRFEKVRAGRFRLTNSRFVEAPRAAQG